MGTTIANHRSIARPSRRLALVAAAVIIGLTACGDPDAATSSDLPVIRLGGSGAGAPAASMADEKLSSMWIGNMDYVWAGSELDTATSMAFRFEGTPTADDLARIAAALGVSGDPVELGADMGGGWQIGPNDGTAPSVTLSADGLGSWWYNGAAAAPTAVECAVPADTSGAVGGDTSTPGGVDTPCAEPQPPEGVPSADEAQVAVEAILAELGVDAGSVEFDVYADEWSAGVTVFPLVGGTRSGLTWSFGFGADAALLWASGLVATPVEVGEYPLIGCAAGVDRLNEQQGWAAYGGPAALDTTIARSDVSYGATPPPELVDPALPIGSVDAEPIVVELTACSIERMPVWAADGTVWLLPSYLYTDAQGGQYSVIAVDDQFLVAPDTEPVPDTVLPVDPTITTVPGTDVPNTVIAEPTVEEAQVLVGLPLADAEQLAARSGWTVRALRVDGEDLAATMDVRPDRVNVEVVDGVVTAVLSVG